MANGFYAEDTYRPKRALEYDVDTQTVIGKFFFIIGGEMADGTKCWYKCDKDGYREEGETAWYSMHRIAGHMVAILEGI